jgi:hypothetical protein
LLPLRDNVPTRAFPAVTVALIVANVAVFVLYSSTTSTGRPTTSPSTRAR